jgi:excisionase family DNA binding protein
MRSRMVPAVRHSIHLGSEYVRSTDSANPRFDCEAKAFRGKTEGNSGERSQSLKERPVSITKRIAVSEIAQRLGIGRLAVYTLLEQGIIPGIRLGRRWIVTLAAYERWERTCGTTASQNAPVRRQAS